MKKRRRFEIMLLFWLLLLPTVLISNQRIPSIIDGFSKVITQKKAVVC